MVPAQSDDPEGARLPKLRLGVLHHQGRTLGHEGASRARSRLAVRRLWHDGHSLALASRGQALRLRRPRKLNLALPLCTLLRGRVILRSSLPQGAGTSGRTRRTRILRDDGVPRTPGTSQPADNRDEGQAAREEHSCHDHSPRGVGGGRQDTVVASKQRGSLHPQRHTPEDGTRQHRDHRHSGD